MPVLRDLLWTAPVARGPHGVAITQVEPAAADEAIQEIGRLVNAPTHQAGRMLGRLVTVLGILADGRSDQTGTQQQAVHPAVAASVARLEEAPAEAWRLDDLAAAVNLDPAYLSRLFRRHTGLSPLGYLARLRAERAASLLAHTTLPAARVGAAVGWDDPTYFARRFRSLVGSTPTQYRERSTRL
jgi:AraC family L-rhamnose operon transcriptional activator RhaR